MMLFLIVFMWVINKYTRPMKNLGDFIALALASTMLLGLTMWPIVAFLHGEFSFPQQATTEHRNIAAIISIAIWATMLHWQIIGRIINWSKKINI